MKFWDDHAEYRDKFAVLAIHNRRPEASTFEELDKLLEDHGILARWERNLPFTVILDNTGETTQRYGIRAYPTAVLIDPEGNIVEGGSVAMLGEKLKAGE
jgi:hypothetical protein